MARKAGQRKEEEESRARQQEEKTPVRHEEKKPACHGGGHHVVEQGVPAGQSDLGKLLRIHTPFSRPCQVDNANEDKVIGATDVKTDPCCCRAMDSDMALGSSTDQDITWP
ncbi:hypothetical protein STEG23_013911 [Scotinomys teguina]